MPDRLATLLPYPVKVSALPGEFPMTAGTPVRPAAGAHEEAAVLRRALATLPWPQPATNDASAVARDAPHITGAPHITVSTDHALPPEGYRLTISQTQINVTAADPAGTFYAAQTIRQLLPDDAYRAAPASATPWSVPCAEIEDAPKLSWRGAHLDVSRHFFPKATVLRFIDALAAHKLNVLHLHLTDDQGWRIESPSHPALHEKGSHRPETMVGHARAKPWTYDGTPHGGYYSLADLAEITAYAGQRMVRVIPEVEVPGHAQALLAAVPELAPTPGSTYQVGTGWGIMPEIIAPLPEAVDFLREIFGELLGAVPSAFVHIGGDECVLDHWRDSPRVEDYRRELGLPSHEALHAHFLRQVADMLADDFGVRAIVWDEGFASTATGEQLRGDTVVMAWRGGDIGRRAALAGHDVVATPVIPTYFDYAQADQETEPLAIGGPVTIEQVAALCPLPRDWPGPAASHLVGTQFQLWSEYIPDPRALDYLAFPRACALAEVAWHGAPAPWTAAEAGQDRPALSGRLAAHLGRLRAAGIEYRPLDGPLPWQQGGTGPRRHWSGTPVAAVARHLAELTEPARS
jgi:hexosaminidase